MLQGRLNEKGFGKSAANRTPSHFQCDRDMICQELHVPHMRCQPQLLSETLFFSVVILQKRVPRLSQDGVACVPSAVNRFSGPIPRRSDFQDRVPWKRSVSLPCHSQDWPVDACQG